MVLGRFVFIAGVQAALAVHNTQSPETLKQNESARVGETAAPGAGASPEGRLGGILVDKLSLPMSGTLEFWSTATTGETAAELEDPVEVVTVDFDRTASAVIEAYGGTELFHPKAEAVNPLKSLVYIKIPKTGGSTFGGICRRIGARRNYSHVEDAYWLRSRKVVREARNAGPSVWANHGRRHDLQGRINRAMPDAYYISSVRDPAERCMAAFYHFEVGRRGLEANNTEKKLHHIRKCARDFESRCLRSDRRQSVVDMFSDFDFLLITERFDESLLALRKAAPWLNLSFADLLYMKAKESGKDATDQVDHFTMPAHVPLSQEPPEVRDALATHWIGSDDERIVRMAHEKLDGFKLKDARELNEFQKMLSTVETQCRAHFHEHCLWNDNGCGQTCIDNIANRNGWQ